MINRFRRFTRWHLAPSLAGFLFAVPLAQSAAQQSSAAAQPAANVPDVGQIAPDFSVPAATRYGLLASPARLSDLRGQTVVLAFFFQARTKG